MQFQVFKPSDSLKDFVHYYWMLEPSNKDEKIIPERVIPTGGLQLFLHYNAPFIIDNKIQPSSYFCGQLTKHKMVMPAENTGVLVTVFYPYSAKAFIHHPINELTDTSIDLVNVFNEEKVHQLISNLRIANDFNQRIKLLEATLIDHFNISNKYQYGLVKQAVDIIDNSLGLLQINKIHESLFIGQRQMERLFKSTVGVSLKMYARIVRFSKALEQLQLKKSMSDVCFEYKYFDQAHLIKEFKRFTGLPPKQLLGYEGNELEEI